MLVERRRALGEADGAVPEGVTVFDDKIPGVANLDPALLGALRRAATDAVYDGVVDSGWRSPEYQEQLPHEAVSKYGPEEEAARWVATPDASEHVSGDAVDIGPAAATAWLSEHGAEYGLCQIYGNEPWHYELRPEAVQLGCPPMYADPNERSKDAAMRGTIASGVRSSNTDSQGAAMARTGDHFKMPDGSLYVVRRSATDTGGESVEMEFLLPPGCVPPPLHVHPAQSEDYEVIEGRFDVVVDGQWRTLSAGESASVPLGAEHTFKNRSGDAVRVRNWHRPAIRFEDFIERMSRTLQAAGVKRKRDPRVPLYLSMIMLEFDDTLVPARTRERLPMQALARLAHLLPPPKL